MPKPQSMRRISGETYYFPGLTNSGYKNGCLIDTSPDETVYAGLDIKKILITHGHADHFSTAPILRRQGAGVYAGREDASLVEMPEINIRGMFSWAKPSDVMVTKLFRGEGCFVDGYLDQWHDPAIQAIPLSGHTLGHYGFLTDDKVLFTGDALYVREIWDRHPLPYAIDIGLVRQSLRLIETVDFAWLVPAHGHPVDRKESVLDITNQLERIDHIEQKILGYLATERTTEELISLISADLGLVENPAQYWLSVTTIKGFLGCLMESGQVEFYVKNHAGYWSAV